MESASAVARAAAVAAADPIRSESVASLKARRAAITAKLDRLRHLTDDSGRKLLAGERYRIDHELERREADAKALAAAKASPCAT